MSEFWNGKPCRHVQLLSLGSHPRNQDCPYREEDDRLHEIECLQRSAQAWEETARMHATNEDFLRGILVSMAIKLGPGVFVSDDGSIQEDPLLLKIPLLLKMQIDAADCMYDATMQVKHSWLARLFPKWWWMSECTTAYDKARRGLL